MKAALYARVSTRLRKEGDQGDREPEWKQDPEVQLAPLRALAAARGWELAGEFVDRESGAKESRTELNRLWAYARQGFLQTVVVWKFDRFARSLRQLAVALDEFRALGIEFISLTESIDTTTPMGRAMFGMVAVFAEFEREITRERIKAGLQKRRAKGLPLGRKPAVFRRDLALLLRQTCGCGHTDGWHVEDDDTGRFGHCVTDGCKCRRFVPTSWSKIAARLNVSPPVVRRSVLGIVRRPVVGPVQNPARREA